MAPARLWKNQTDNHNMNDKIEAWALNHASLILLVLFFVLGMLFVILCYTLVGVSAVESGGMRNFANSGLL